MKKPDKNAGPREWNRYVRWVRAQIDAENRADYGGADKDARRSLRLLDTHHSLSRVRGRALADLWIEGVVNRERGSGHGSAD